MCRHSSQSAEKKRASNGFLERSRINATVCMMCRCSVNNLATVEGEEDNRMGENVGEARDDDSGLQTDKWLRRKIDTIDPRVP